MMLSESLEREGHTGLLLHAVGKNESVVVPARITLRSTGWQVIRQREAGLQSLLQKCSSIALMVIGVINTVPIAVTHSNIDRIFEVLV
ncbi:hypothetical protein KIN20_010450 [Parelaphostrongylus tenuis]|uniref:Uncharacterized protein n=1 Tax=Parelaphostrongylus tenuis TaxID=148309 RepID=A0AAD5MTE5_PARTN|nr:hypothetical protein KIN20_010450 [Parelaphostrongylus tenuis]